MPKPSALSPDPMAARPALRLGGNVLPHVVADLRETADQVGHTSTLPRDGRPYLTAEGELVIPMHCPRRYRWWAGGQSLRATLIELGAGPATWRKYSTLPYGDIETPSM